MLRVNGPLRRSAGGRPPPARKAGGGCRAGSACPGAPGSRGRPSPRPAAPPRPRCRPRWRRRSRRKPAAGRRAVGDRKALHLILEPAQLAEWGPRRRGSRRGARWPSLVPPRSRSAAAPSGQASARPDLHHIGMARGVVSVQPRMSEKIWRKTGHCPSSERMGKSPARPSHVASGPDRRRMAPFTGNQGRQAMAESSLKTPGMFDPEALLAVQRRNFEAFVPARSSPRACAPAPRARPP